MDAEQFLADLDALRNDDAEIRELLVSHIILKDAVKQFLACFFDKGNGESKFMLRRFDVCDLVEAYRRACYYDD